LVKNLFIRPFRQGFVNNGGSTQKSRGQSRSHQKEGDISIDYDPRKNKRKDNGVGEYIDYEEVD
jgi:hypothetical protein